MTARLAGQALPHGPGDPSTPGCSLTPPIAGRPHRDDTPGGAVAPMWVLSCGAARGPTFEHRHHRVHEGSRSAPAPCHRGRSPVLRALVSRRNVVITGSPITCGAGEPTPCGRLTSRGRWGRTGRRPASRPSGRGRPVRLHALPRATPGGATHQVSLPLLAEGPSHPSAGPRLSGRPSTTPQQGGIGGWDLYQV